MCCTWKFWIWDVNTWTAITAVGTVLLAVFALAAWKTSKKSLDLATHEAAAARALAVKSLDSQARSEQITALAAYVRSLYALSEIQTISPARYHVPNKIMPVTGSAPDDLGYPSYLSDLCQNVEVSGALWRIHHIEIDEAFSVFANFEYSIIESVKIWASLPKETDQSNKLRNVNSEYIKLLELNARNWQADLESRKLSETTVRASWESFQEEVETISGKKLY